MVYALSRFLTVAAEVKLEFVLRKLENPLEECVVFKRKYVKLEFISSNLFELICSGYSKSQSSGEFPNPPTKNSDFSSVAKVSHQREPIPYICGLGARFGCERVSEHSNRRD